MEQVGSQVKLPFGRAFQISVQGIRIRLGRSLVTVLGVMLGIAFLMSNLTTQLIKSAVAREQELRQTVNLMLTLIKSEIGSVEGKRLAVAMFGQPTEAEKALLEKILASSPAEVRAFGIEAKGLAAVPAKGLGTGASLLLVLGSGKECPAAIADLTSGMTQKVILDSLAGRSFAGTRDPGVRLEFFFGKQTEEQIARLKAEARQASFRTAWIVIISLLVTVIGVSNSLLMSVTERFREIGTMKCLGALSSFIRTLFLIESSLVGLVGSVFGAVLGALLPLVVYGLTYNFHLVFGSVAYGGLLAAGVASIVVGTILSVCAAIYPAGIASRMVPASALRSTV